MGSKLAKAICVGTTVALALSGVATAHRPRDRHVHHREQANPPFMTANDCIEHQAYFDGDPRAVAARLPRGYSAELDPSSGKPLLFARAEHCQVGIARHAAGATIANFGVVVRSPDGLGCSSGAPAIGSLIGTAPPVCNWYPLAWLATDRRMVSWLRAGTPTFPARLVRRMSFALGAPSTAGLTSFHFASGGLAATAFSMDDTGSQGPAQLNVRGGYWNGPLSAPMKLAFSSNDITPGYANGIVRARGGSLLAVLIGADQASYLPAYAPIAAEHWGHGSYRKQVDRPVRHEHSFSGSCSLSGVDTFDPPATNTAQDLHVTYAARGTCSGTLDGRQLQQAPVNWLSDGRSHGSCSQASTIAPGSAALTFANGVTIRSTFDFTSLLTEVDFSFYGERSGFASGHATFATRNTTPAAITNCAGAGDRQVPMDLSLATRSPLVSTSR